MPKKLLSQILKERTETIEYRKIKSQLMKIEQNGKAEMFIRYIKPETIEILVNEGINIVVINEHGYDTHKLSW